MPISDVDNMQVFVGDGNNPDFVYPYYMDTIDSLIITITVQTNPLIVTSVTFLEFTTDWTTVTTPDEFGAYPLGVIVHFLTPPANNVIITMYRNTKKTQQTQYADDDPLTAGSLNHALDKLTVMVQDYTIQRFKGVQRRPPTDSNKTYKVGDFFINENPIPGTFFGWVCTTGGSPGTWKAFGAILT